MIYIAGLCAVRRLWHTPLQAALLGSILSLSACSTMQDQPGGNADTNTIKEQLDNSRAVPQVERTVLADLASIAKQIYDPVSTTLQINNTNADPALQYLVAILSEYGFGVQRVSADQGANFMAYRNDVRRTGLSRAMSASLAIGAVEISRDYTIRNGNLVTPTSKVRLSGTRVPVVVNDVTTARRGMPDPTLSQAQYIASMSLDEQAPVIQLITPELVDRVTSASFDSDSPSLQALNSSNVEVNNLFYGDTSTFANVLDNYNQVDRLIVIFGNDSMILGDTNKQLIDQFVSSTLDENDVVSLVGCSNGPTALEIGNEGLALGRAKRVTQELMAQGVARDRILDEGCWAPVNAGDRFPSRGVVLELWRKNA